jgi:hypothetical protein
MEEFVGDAIKIAMAIRQLFTWHHVQNARDIVPIIQRQKEFLHFI